MTSSFFFIKKADGSLRLVQDYRKLNEMTVKNCYPLPLIGELLNKLKDARYFSKMDIRWGYTNIRIKEGDEWKGAFLTPHGLFEPLVMFFGMTNAPATFMKMMNDIFKELIKKGKIIVYMDNILVFSKTEKKHWEMVQAVLEILKYTAGPKKPCCGISLIRLAGPITQGYLGTSVALRRHLSKGHGVGLPVKPWQWVDWRPLHRAGVTSRHHWELSL